MSRSRLRRTLAVAASGAAVTAAVAAPSPALAGELFFSKSSGTVASTSWLEIGELPTSTGVQGNAHFGDLYVIDGGAGQAPEVFGSVYDVQCKKGVTPYNPGGGHGEPDRNGPCQLVSTRWIEGGSLTFSVDRKLTKATLTGTLAVGTGHGDGPVGSPPVSITWTGTGETYSSRYSGSYVSEYGTETYRYSFEGRQATIAAGSKIGPMVFDDETGESSTAELGRFRSFDRFRG